MARAIVLSGSYMMLYARHGAAPPEAAFAEVRLDTPDMSARMDELRAAILRPQLAALDEAVAARRTPHDRMTAALSDHPRIVLPARPAKERHVGSSFQFRLPGIAPEVARAFLAACAGRGMELKWFDAPEPVGFTSAHASWRYVPRHEPPRTDAVLAGLFDLRLPLTFEAVDVDLIAAHIQEAAA